MSTSQVCDLETGSASSSSLEAQGENEELLAVVRRHEPPLRHLEALLLQTPWQKLPFQKRAVLASLYADQFGKRGTSEYQRKRLEYTLPIESL